MDSDDDMHNANDVDPLEDYCSGDTAADSNDDNDADYDFDNDFDEDPEAIMIYRYQVCSILDLELWFFFYSCLVLEEKVVGFSRKAELFFFVYFFD